MEKPTQLVHTSLLTGLWILFWEIGQSFQLSSYQQIRPPFSPYKDMVGMKSTTLNCKEVNKMIEVNTTWEFLPNIDQQAYGESAGKTVGTMLKATGLVEFRAHRNILGTPQVRSTSVWKTLSDWAAYTDSDEWRTLEAEVRTFVTNIRIEIWGPSPVLPEPVRPG